VVATGVIPRRAILRQPTRRSTVMRAWDFKVVIGVDTRTPFRADGPSPRHGPRLVVAGASLGRITHRQNRPGTSAEAGIRTPAAGTATRAGADVRTPEAGTRSNSKNGAARRVAITRNRLS